jgi:plasmid stabilization system protein ParE
MKRLVFTPAAWDDLTTIGLFIAEDNPERADGFVAELEAKAALIRERPLSFPERADVSPGLRPAVHGRYLLLFRDLADDARIAELGDWRGAMLAHVRGLVSQAAHDVVEAWKWRGVQGAGPGSAALNRA